jgi:hypothetical protein
MIIESLIVKGLFTIGHAIAAHGTAASTGMMIAHSVTTYGLVSTVSTLATVGLVVGGISWTADKVNLLTKGLDAIDKGNYIGAASNFAQLSSVLNIHVRYLPDVVENFLIEGGIPITDAHNAKLSIQNIEDMIIKLK